MPEFKKSTVREYFESIVIAVILALFIRTFVVQAFKIPTGSMENNLLIGDHLLVNKFIFGPTESRLERILLPVKQLKREDIVVFKYPEEPERDFIKRVIGLPGETVEVREKKVFINGKALDEPYAHYLEPVATPSEFHEVTSFDVRERYGPVTVPPDHYFVMGDNRDNSQDSRYWGFLPREYIKGKALILYLVVRSRARGLPGGWSRRHPQRPRVGVRPFLHADPLGPHVPSDSLMLKLLIKLALAGLIANAAWRMGSTYLSFYRFKDAVSETAEYSKGKSDAELEQRILEIASNYDVPLTDDKVTVRRQDEHTLVEGSYVQPDRRGARVPLSVGVHVQHRRRHEHSVAGRTCSTRLSALNFHQLAHRLGCHAGERKTFSPSTLAADDADRAAGQAEEGREVVDERLVGGAVDRCRRQPHHDRVVAHAAELGFSCAGNHADVDLDARSRLTNQGWP